MENPEDGDKSRHRHRDNKSRHRKRDYREDQAGEADRERQGKLRRVEKEENDGRSRQRWRKSHRVEEEEEEEAENIQNWVRTVRLDDWTGDIRRRLIAMGITHSEFDAASKPRGRQGLFSDEKAWVAPRRTRQRKWHLEGAHGTREWLPFHLILGCLPIRQLCQLPCLCKPWYLMLEAGEVQVDTHAKREEYWFVMSKPPPPGQKNWDFMAFSSHSDGQGRRDWAFFRPPLPSESHSKLLSLLGGPHCSLLLKHDIMYLKAYWWPRLIGTGGIMCALVHEQGAADVYNIIVFNCLTGSAKVLPPPLDPCHLFGQTPLCRMQMAIDDVDPTRYYIMLTRQFEMAVPGYFEIFDSRIGSWKVGCTPGVPSGNHEAAYGDFFVMTRRMELSTLFAYHAADDVWSVVQVRERMLEEYGYVPTLLKWKGRLFRAFLLQVESFFWFGFVVMELKMTSPQDAVWEVVARTPQCLWHWLPRPWDCMIEAEGSLFYMTIGKPRLGRYKPPLVYDAELNEWYVLPSERGTTESACILVHRPRLSMRMPALADSESADEALVPLPG